MKGFVKLRRLREIGVVVARYGLGPFLPSPIIKFLRLGKPQDGSEKFRDLPVERRLRLAFEELGTTFIKLGQLLSLRRDLMPESIVAEFKQLQDNVSPVPFDMIRPIVERELASDIDEIFSFFNETPLASASISQVYEAVLRENGEDVVVKVRKPFVVENIKGDMEILFWIADLMQRHSSLAERFDFKGVVEEFFLAMNDELNLMIEKNNTRKFKANFSEDEWDWLTFPRMFDHLCTSSVLVMERVGGDKLYTLDASESERRSIAENGARMFLKQVLVDGFFHADLHAGNLFFHSDGRVAIVDCGLAGSLDPYTREKIAEMFIAFAGKDFLKLTSLYLEMSGQGEDVDKKEISKEMERIVNSLPEAIGDVDMGELFAKLFTIFYRHKLRVPRNLSILIRALTALEGMSRELDPDFKLMRHSEELARIFLRSRYTPERIGEELFQAALRLMDMTKSLPENFSEIMEKMERGKLQHRVLFLFSQEDKGFISRLVTRISAAFILTGSIISFRSFEESRFAIPVYILFALTLLIFLFTFRRGSK